MISVKKNFRLSEDSKNPSNVQKNWDIQKICIGDFSKIRAFVDTARAVLKLSFFRTLREHGLTNDVKAVFQVFRGICSVVFVSGLAVEANVTRKPPDLKSTY